jgi:hypothetical protein
LEVRVGGVFTPGCQINARLRIGDDPRRNGLVGARVLQIKVSQSIKLTALLIPEIIETEITVQDQILSE